MKRDVRIAIIGCGGIAHGKHMPSLKKVKEAKMVAFCDIIRERAEEAAEKYGVEGAGVYTDYKEMIEKERWRNRRLFMYVLPISHTLK